MFYCFSTCRNFIRTLPNLVYDETDVEDIDTTQEDHIYDEFRYVCMANPIKARSVKAKPLILYDPLSSQDGYLDQEYKRFGFYTRY